MENPTPPPSFQDSFTTLLVQTEELRRKLSGKQQRREDINAVKCLDIVHDMDELAQHLFHGLVPAPNDEMELDLRKHCQQKVREVAMDALRVATTKAEEDPTDEDRYIATQEQACQGGIARMAELNLALCEDIAEDGVRKQRHDEVVDVYASYQRHVIRQRSKPSIARLVDYRKRRHSSPSSRHRAPGHDRRDGGDHDDEDDDDGDDDGESKSQHVHVIATILGQASALILPLMQWKAALPPEHNTALHRLCDNSLSTLDEQAQTLTNTVATWFMEDRRIDDYWMAKSAAEEPCLDQLGELDGVVYELSFCCQVFDRYINFVAPLTGVTSATNQTLQEMHPVWTWKYASLERYLTTQQLQSAMQHAGPVQIVVGMPIQVPSVVEDAQYLSTRALQRAASTRSTQAIGTVAHSIASDVWSTDAGGGVHEALMEQRGCYRDDGPPDVSSTAATNGSADTVPMPNSSSFAQALLGALDEDLDGAPNNGPGGHTTNRSPKAVRSPNSSTGVGFLGSLSSSLASSGVGDRFLQVRLNTWLCALNGAHSASTACSSLVDYLDSLLADMESEPSHEDGGHRNASTHNDDQATSMIHLAREELFRHATRYHDLMKEQAVGVVGEFCGRVQDAPVYRGSTFVPVLRYSLERENYELPNAQQLQLAEDDARLHKILIQPMDDCRLLRQLEKCDGEVLRFLCQEIARTIVDLFMDVLLYPVSPKRFTDWGSLLLSKEVRTVQTHLQSLLHHAASKAAASSQDQALPVLTTQWERLSEAVMILQLEKPSDWAYYQATSVVSPQELRAILQLRVDFSNDAVQAVAVAAAIQGQE